MPNLESHGCARGDADASRGSQEMNNVTGTYIFTENCPEAQVIPTFFGGWMTLWWNFLEASKVRIEDQAIATKPGDLFQRCPEK